MLQTLAEQIEGLLFPVFTESGFELVDLCVRQAREQIYIEVLADKPGGGINLDECAFLNRKFIQTIEEAGVLQEGFFLEVSSPGLDRPLKTRKDFLRMVNRDIVFYLSQAVGNRIEWSGRLKEVKEEEVLINAGKKEILIPLNFIVKARQVI